MFSLPLHSSLYFDDDTPSSWALKAEQKRNTCTAGDLEPTFLLIASRLSAERVWLWRGSRRLSCFNLSLKQSKRQGDALYREVKGAPSVYTLVHVPAGVSESFDSGIEAVSGCLHFSLRVALKVLDRDTRCDVFCSNLSRRTRYACRRSQTHHVTKDELRLLLLHAIAISTVPLGLQTTSSNRSNHQRDLSPDQTHDNDHVSPQFG